MVHTWCNPLPHSCCVIMTVQQQGLLQVSPHLNSVLDWTVCDPSVMSFSLPQGATTMKGPREPWSLTESDMHTPLTACGIILTHLHYTPLGCGHGAHLIHTGCENASQGAQLAADSKFSVQSKRCVTPVATFYLPATSMFSINK